MIPRRPSNDIADGGLAYPVLSCEGMAGLSAGISFPDGVDLLCRQSRVAVALASVGASLAHAVGQIVCLRAKEQMRRVDTPWGVAGVADKKSVGDRPLCDMPRKAVGGPDTLLSLTSESDPSVSSTSKGFLPQPARVGSARAVDVVPESFDLLRGKLILHWDSPPGAAPGVFAAPPGTSISASVYQKEA